jgi:hypothetical protein
MADKRPGELWSLFLSKYDFAFELSEDVGKVLIEARKSRQITKLLKMSAVRVLDVVKDYQTTREIPYLVEREHKSYPVTFLFAAP